MHALPSAKFADTQLNLRLQGWRRSHGRGSHSREWKLHQSDRSWMPGAQEPEDLDKVHSREAQRAG